jgi:hypothetical protein
MKKMTTMKQAASTTLPGLPESAKKKAKNAAFKNSIRELLEEYFVRWNPKWGRNRKGKLLAEAFWHLKDGVAQEGLMTLAKKQLRETIYHPFHVLRAMDFADGRTLSYEGIEVLKQDAVCFQLLPGGYWNLLESLRFLLGRWNARSCGLEWYFLLGCWCV